MPSASESFASEAVSLAVWVAFAQPLAGAVKTYTAPAETCVPTIAAPAPTATVLPDTAMPPDAPRLSPASPSEAVSLAAWTSGSIVIGYCARVASTVRQRRPPQTLIALGSVRPRASVALRSE